MEYTTSKGTKIELRPISLMLINKIESGVRKEYEARGEPVMPPTYEVEVAGGGKIVQYHDETTLVVEGDDEKTAANREAWNKHLLALAKMRNEVRDAQTAVILEGIIFEMPTGWEERHRRLHVEVPEDPTDKRLHYIQTELLVTPEELTNVIGEIMILSSAGAAKEEDIAAARRTFRNKLGQGKEATAS